MFSMYLRLCIAFFAFLYRAEVNEMLCQTLTFDQFLIDFDQFLIDFDQFSINLH